MNIQESPVGGYEVVKLAGRWVIIRPQIAEDGRILSVHIVGDESALSSWGRRKDAVQATVRLAYHEMARQVRAMGERSGAQGERGVLAGQVAS